MPWTLRDANLNSPDAIMNRIVRQLNQMDDAGRLTFGQAFPLVELSDSQEKHFTMDGIRPGMRQTAMASESPVGDIEGLGERDVTVSSFKKKIQPEKGVNTELNSQVEILNLFNATADALMEDLMLTRAEASWRGLDDIEGLIGVDGDSAHSEIDSTHVATPGTSYDNTGTATPISDFIDAEYRINEDGSALSQAGPITAYMSPSVLKDLKLNDDIQTEYDNVRALSEQQLTDAFQIDQIQVVRTQVIRRDHANGGIPVDSAGTALTESEDLSDAAQDNILEPYDVGDSSQRRNIVIGAPGQVSAFMPWFLDRLAERGDAAPQGDVSVDATNGWMTQTWTDVDPLSTWFKAAQEFGFHVTRGDNWYVIQDI